MIDFPLNTLGITHQVVAQFIPKGGFCIDATAGRGRDTAFLCECVGAEGRVLAFDIQPDAIAQTKKLLAERGFSDRTQVVLDSHSHMLAYAQPNTADVILFNFGWLPGGDHTVFTTPETSIPAIEAALEVLKPDGLLSLCIYYGGASGYGERDALLEYLKTVDNTKYTVILSPFYNRDGDPPIPVFIFKHP